VFQANEKKKLFCIKKAFSEKEKDDEGMVQNIVRWREIVSFH